ncbi:DUF3558 domain-containing protein [Mycobacteroides abscessus]|uniref:DUF3558 domain-containing protein n=1 Tax=Mycobacteroides abscessus TaxID=36809 RepID=UPI0009A5D6B4|nr:DUF3558 domain-containing protein [Mycobacteroides abscessus]MBN7442607.1 DUF3558 domain-containing protein [Mycobacteroides abscessus subsp. abscessus]SKF98474.1 Protein of uncharacterised function (DUF3558) [Mycobacteroides abscessus subsp. massiliense]SKH14842.1 Protein of uncharacterised function (DUF3558) [Mycobacteroides abscessus subsp. massiliense]SKI02734.1 Protein of uncharacterised function (DUF3558) [Mycobacteroides abscessus subsp. massiliense]SKI71140.1 Protein of uncharacteri
MRRSVLVLAVCAAVGLSGCSTSTITSIDATKASSTGSVAGSSSTVATNTLQAPHPQPNTNNNGTSFDPCLAYTADELKSWGVAPGSVEDKGVKDTIQRGCLWKGDGWVLQQLVVNRQLDEYLDQELFPGAEAITVGGLSAVKFRSPPEDMTGCYVEIPSQKATVGTIVSVRDSKAKQAIPDACTKAVAIAEDTAKKLPK